MIFDDNRYGLVELPMPLPMMLEFESRDGRKFLVVRVLLLCRPIERKS